MKIWCLVSNVDDYIEKFGEKFINKKWDGFDLIFIDYSSIEIGTGERPAFFCMGKKLELPDAFWLWTGNTDARVIEHLLISCGIKSISNLEEQNVVRSKVATYNRMAAAGLRVPRTLVFFNHADRDMIKEKFSFPFVIKPDNGFGGEGVALIHNDEELESYLADLKYGVAYMAQEYISTSRGRDVRVVMLNGECFHCYIRQAGDPDEFRSNIHTGGSRVAYELDDETKEMCRKAAALFDLKVIGLDLMFGEDGFVFSEANSFPGLQKEYRDQVFKTVIGDFLRENEK